MGKGNGTSQEKETIGVMVIEQLHCYRDKTAFILDVNTMLIGWRKK